MFRPFKVFLCTSLNEGWVDINLKSLLLPSRLNNSNLLKHEEVDIDEYNA